MRSRAKGEDDEDEDDNDDEDDRSDEHDHNGAGRTLQASHLHPEHLGLPFEHPRVPVDRREDRRRMARL